jgi:hypothetical protein
MVFHFFWDVWSTGFVLFKNGQKIWSGKGVLSYNELKEVLDKNLQPTYTVLAPLRFRKLI